jgi:hypothetical protein
MPYDPDQPRGRFLKTPAMRLVPSKKLTLRLSPVEMDGLQELVNTHAEAAKKVGLKANWTPESYLRFILLRTLEDAGKLEPAASVHLTAQALSMDQPKMPHPNLTKKRKAWSAGKMRMV